MPDRAGVSVSKCRKFSINLAMNQVWGFFWPICCDSGIAAMSFEKKCSSLFKVLEYEMVLLVGICFAHFLCWAPRGRQKNFCFLFFPETSWPAMFIHLDRSVNFGCLSREHDPSPFRKMAVFVIKLDSLILLLSADTSYLKGISGWKISCLFFGQIGYLLLGSLFSLFGPYGHYLSLFSLLRDRQLPLVRGGQKSSSVKLE